MKKLLLSIKRMIPIKIKKVLKLIFAPLRRIIAMI